MDRLNNDSEKAAGESRWYGSWLSTRHSSVSCSNAPASGVGTKPVATQSREGLLQDTLRRAAESRYFLFVCGMLALAGTVSAAYPVSWVVLPGTLVSQPRWRSIALSVALGSALGATALVLVFHHWGWSWVYARFPEFASHASWQKIVGWVSVYGIPGLFAIALSPLPQTPALVVFGIVDPQPAAVFVTILAAKVIKYGIVAWFVSRFPERFHGGLRGLLGRVSLPNQP